MLSAPLPRVYEETSGGKVVPLNASQGAGQVVLPIGGTDFNAEELAKISKETSKKLESEVLAPMERWMNAYNLVQVGEGLPEAARAACRRQQQRRVAGRPEQTGSGCWVAPGGAVGSPVEFWLLGWLPGCIRCRHARHGPAAAASPQLAWHAVA